MHTCVTYTPRSAPPMEMIPAMLEGTKRWIDRYGEMFDQLWWYTQGGGVGILDVNDEKELMRMMAAHPWSPYCDIQIHALVDPRTGIDTYSEVIAEQMAMMGGAPAA
jgi:muconolactone delta-isomerase